MHSVESVEQADVVEVVIFTAFSLDLLYSYEHGYVIAPARCQGPNLSTAIGAAQEVGAMPPDLPTTATLTSAHRRTKDSERIVYQSTPQRSG